MTYSEPEKSPPDTTHSERRDGDKTAPEVREVFTIGPVGRNLEPEHERSPEEVREVFDFLFPRGGRPPVDYTKSTGAAEDFSAPLEIRIRRWASGSERERAAVINELRAVLEAERTYSPSMDDAEAERLLECVRERVSGECRDGKKIEPVQVGELCWPPVEARIDALAERATLGPEVDLDLVADIIIANIIERGTTLVTTVRFVAEAAGIPEDRAQRAMDLLRTTRVLSVAQEMNGASAWTWTPHRLAFDQNAFAAQVKKDLGIQDTPAPGMGHNSEGADMGLDGDAETPNALDPGPDAGFSLELSPLVFPDHIPSADVRKFEKALAAQGDEKVRLPALTQAAYRARDELKPHAPWKLYSIISDHSKGQMRCCVLGFDYIAEHGGFTDRAQVSRLIKDLEDRKLITALRFETTDGNSRSRVFLAPIVTARDRMKGSITDAMADIKARVAEKKAKEAERLRHLRASKKAKPQQGDE